MGKLRRGLWLHVRGAGGAAGRRGDVGGARRVGAGRRGGARHLAREFESATLCGRKESTSKFFINYEYQVNSL